MILALTLSLAYTWGRGNRGGGRWKGRPGRGKPGHSKPGYGRPNYSKPGYGRPSLPQKGNDVDKGTYTRLKFLKKKTIIGDYRG